MTRKLATQALHIRTGMIICTAALLTLTALETIAQSDQHSARREHVNAPYPDMPKIAPIGARIGQHLPIPEAAKGAPIDPAKGYRLEELGKGLYMITDNAYQSMFMVYETDVIVVDAPPAYASHIVNGIREKTDKQITHLIYSHSHVDHIAGAKSLGSVPTIIAHEETKRLLARAKDPNRPLPTVTFQDRYSLKLGSQVLELSYHGDAHEPGNILIYAPA